MPVRHFFSVISGAKMELDQPGGRTQNLLIPCLIVVRRLAIGPTGRSPIGLVEMCSAEPEPHSRFGSGSSPERFEPLTPLILLILLIPLVLELNLTQANNPPMLHLISTPDTNQDGPD
ncbi:hypothetical protein LY78DRAFT_133999 [Colletotrichum sublineola]|nr:hypothetical protein LY78DRAFT_133999 [Colletotrichum sublineola]